MGASTPPWKPFASADVETESIERNSAMNDLLEGLREAGRELVPTMLSRVEVRDDVQAGDVIRGTIAGAVGGLAAAWVMSKAWVALDRMISDRLKVDEEPKEKRGERAAAPHEEETATARAADSAAQGFLGRHLDKRERNIAGPAMHYAFGATTGAVYGGLAEAVPQVTAGAGTVYATLVWLLGDEVAVPALGLTDPPWRQSPTQHVNAFVAHLVYGLTTDGVRRIARRMI